MEGLNAPLLSVVKLTVPVGAVGMGEVSVTVAAQVVARFTETVDGAQDTVVNVVWTPNESVKANVPLLVPWLLSPL